MRNEEKELISVIVPVYNVEAYLPHCLKTIAQQTYMNLEIIIVDDGSTDLSGKICDEYAKKDNRAIVMHQKHLGLWTARNAGLRMMHGNYVTFVDSDDYIRQDFIKILFDSINQDEGYNLAIVGRKETHIQDEDTTMTSKNYKKTIYTQEDLILNRFYYKHKDINSTVWNRLYKADLIKGLYFNNYALGEDIDFNFRYYLRIKNAISIDHVLYFWYQRQGSLTHQDNFASLNNQCVTEQLFQYLTNMPSLPNKYKHHILKHLYRKMVFLIGRAWKTNNEIELFERCKLYIKQTHKKYWMNIHINPFEKIVITCLLNNPRLAQYLLKKTNNY